MTLDSPRVGWDEGEKKGSGLLTERNVRTTERVEVDRGKDKKECPHTLPREICLTSEGLCVTVTNRLRYIVVKGTRRGS